MRVLFVSDTYYPHVNGVYNFVRQLGSHLQNKGHQVAVLASSETMRSTRKKIDNIDVFGIPSIPVLYYPQIRIPIPFILYAEIGKVISGYRPDIIHIQSHFFLGKATVKVNKRFGIPIIGTNHFMPENLTAFLNGQKWKKWLEPALWSSFSKVFNQLSLVTAPTETAAGLIRERLDMAVTVVSNGIDLQKFNTSGDKRLLLERFRLPDKPVLLFVGRLDPEKKLDDVLKAVAIALSQLDFYFLIAGKGIRRMALENLANKLGIAHRVIFAGFVPDIELPYFYKLSTCFIMASTAELQSIATMEAMASGLPVIAANAGALSELVHDKMNGYLFKSGDINGMVECLCKAFSSINQLEKMGRSSLEIILKHDICKSAEAFQTIYQKIIDQSSSAINKQRKNQSRISNGEQIIY